MESTSPKPIPAKPDSDYERYMQIREIFALQKLPEDMAHRDELLFQIVHQTAELWLKHSAADLNEAGIQIELDQFVQAHYLISRAHAGLDCVDTVTRMLDSMAMADFQSFRGEFASGTNFESPGFRLIKRAAARLFAQFEAALFRHRAHLADVVESNRTHPELHALATVMLDWDRKLGKWRYLHFRCIERLSGDARSNTRETTVDLAIRRLHQPVFPQLWDASVGN